MKRKAASLEALMASQGPAAETTALPSPSAQPVKAVEKATVYLPRAAHKRLKLMALEHERPVNDFLREGVDMMLAKYGQPSLKDFEER